MKKNNSIFAAIITLVCLCLCLSLAACGDKKPTDTKDVPDTVKPAIAMDGVQGNTYQKTVEPGENALSLPTVTATDAHDGNITSFVDVACDKGKEYITYSKNKNGVLVSLDCRVVGTYVVTYTVTDMADNAADPLVATVTVHDGTAPVLTMEGDLDSFERSLFSGETLDLPTVTATDAYDGDLTQNIEVTCDKGESCITVSKTQSGVDVSFGINDEGTYVITYSVSDAAGNQGTFTATIHVGADTIDPVLSSANKAESYTVRYATALTLPTFTASDNHDGNITSDIEVSCDSENVTLTKVTTTDGTYAKFVASKSGTYTVKYEVTDKSGNKASEEIAVTVYDDIKPMLAMNNVSGKTYDVKVFAGDTVTLPAVYATDHHDGDISDAVTVACSFGNETVSKTDGCVVTVPSTVAAGEYTVAYNVSDVANNAADTFTVNVVVVSEKTIEMPGIEYIDLHTQGKTAYELALGNMYPGYTLTSAKIGDITLESEQYTYTDGTFAITYAELNKRATEGEGTVKDFAIPHGEAVLELTLGKDSETYTLKKNIAICDFVVSGDKSFFEFATWKKNLITAVDATELTQPALNDTYGMYITMTDDAGGWVQTGAFGHAWASRTDLVETDFEVEDGYWFCGTFDGRGHDVGGFTGKSIFGNLYKATVKNVYVSAFFSAGDSIPCAPIACYAYDTTVSDVYAQLNYNSTDANASNSGGIVAKMYNGAIKNCVVVFVNFKKGTVNPDGYQAGVVGAGDNIVIDNCMAVRSMNTSNNSKRYVTGYYGTATNVELTDCPEIDPKNTLYVTVYIPDDASKPPFKAGTEYPYLGTLYDNWFENHINKYGAYWRFDSESKKMYIGNFDITQMPFYNAVQYVDGKYYHDSYEHFESNGTTASIQWESEDELASPVDTSDAAKITIDLTTVKANMKEEFDIDEIEILSIKNGETILTYTLAFDNVVIDADGIDLTKGFLISVRTKDHGRSYYWFAAQ